MNLSTRLSLSLSTNDYWVWDHSFHSILDNLPTTQLQTTPHRHTDYQPTFIHPPCLPLPNNHYLFTSYLSLFANVRLVNQMMMMMIRRSTFAISFPHHLSLTLFHSLSSSLLLSEALVATYQFKVKKEENEMISTFFLTFSLSFSLWSSFPSFVLLFFN